MDPTGMAVERFRQHRSDDGCDVARIDIASRRRAERARELPSRLDRSGRPEEVLHEEVWLDEREGQARIHDHPLGGSVLPAEGERGCRVRADRGKLHQMMETYSSC